MIAEKELVTVYRGTVQSLYAYVLQRSGRNRELTEDAVQETYMRALSHWRRKGLPDVPLAWLKTVARNILVSHYRRIKPESLDDRRFDPNCDSWDLEKRDNAALLFFGLSHIKKEHARLLESFYFDEKSVREIAAERNLSQRAVEGRLRRARQKLKKYLRRYVTDQGGSK